jgi:hypothetical protein
MSCSGRGVCNTTIGICICRFGYSGDECSLRDCVNNCTFPNGVCNTTTGVCDCIEPHDGIDCSFLTCPGECINNATCNKINGECVCQKGWTGPSCALVKCPSDCKPSNVSNGQCIGGVCNCIKGFTGDNCGIQEPDLVLIVVLAIILGLAVLGLLVGGFMIWRAITIAKLRNIQKAEGGEAEEISMEAKIEDISSSDDS